MIIKYDDDQFVKVGQISRKKTAIKVFSEESGG